MRRYEHLSELEPCERPRVRTPLADWLASHPDVSARSLRVKIRAGTKSFQNWRNGRALPSLVYAFKLERVTAGGVPASSWLGTELGRMAWRNTGEDPEVWKRIAKVAHKRWRKKRANHLTKKRRARRQRQKALAAVTAKHIAMAEAGIFAAVPAAQAAIEAAGPIQ